MELKDFDLYINGFVEEFADGSRYLEREDIIYNGNDTDKIHTVKENDTLTKLAFRYYVNSLNNSPKYWWIIADANDITNPMDISDLIGYDIVIPDPVLFLLNL